LRQGREGGEGERKREREMLGEKIRITGWNNINAIKMAFNMNKCEVLDSFQNTILSNIEWGNETHL
jgi:hypothetical protein